MKEQKFTNWEIIINVVIILFALFVIAQETTRETWIALGATLALVLLAIRNIIRALSDISKENARKVDILAHKADWGEDICQVLIEQGYNVDDRLASIMAHLHEWGDTTVKLLLLRTVSEGMTDAMVKLSLGEPSSIDDVERTEKVVRQRWVYGNMQRHARTILFENGVVSKVNKK